MRALHVTCEWGFVRAGGGEASDQTVNRRRNERLGVDLAQFGIVVRNVEQRGRFQHNKRTVSTYSSLRTFRAVSCLIVLACVPTFWFWLSRTQGS